MRFCTLLCSLIIHLWYTRWLVKSISVMEAKEARYFRILNSTAGSFFSGLNERDQTSLLGVLEDFMKRAPKVYNLQTK